MNADITGEFYMAIDPVPIQAGTLIHYIATATFKEVGGASVVDFSILPLAHANHEPIPDVKPNTWTDLSVNNGVFIAPLDDAIIPAMANPITGGDVVLQTGSQLIVSIQNADFFGGLALGQTNLGTKLDGSTIGGIRITAGTTGAALPAPVPSCEGKPTGGGNDAGTDAISSDV